MLERFRHYLFFCLLWLVASSPVYGGSPGKMEMHIRDKDNRRTETTISVGDTMTVQMWVRKATESAGVVQTDLYVSFDDDFLRLIPEAVTGQGGGQIRPFKQGTYLGGTVQTNWTEGDVIGNQNANKVSLFQVGYSEVIPRSPGGSQRSANADSAEVATFRLHAIRKPPNGGRTSVRLDPKNPGGGSETGYNIVGDAGNIRNFNRFTNLSVDVIGLQLTFDLPVLELLPGIIDSTVDLDDHVDDPVNADSTIVWTLGTPVPDSITVSLSDSNKVVIDPRFPVAGADSGNFIGIVKIPITATTLLNDVLTDTLLVIVDTPPAFDIPAMRAILQPTTPQSAADSSLVTVLVMEDISDTTLVLIADDPDPGAVVDFASIDASPNIFTSLSPDDGRVTITMAENFYGEETRRFVAADEFGRADTVRVRIVVTPVNDPPEFIKEFEPLTVGTEGQAALILRDFVEDVDDLHETLAFSFSDADSIAFEVTSGNERLLVTSLPGFVGIRDVEISVRDTSDETDFQTINITVQPPSEPIAPEVLSPFLKVDVRAGDSSVPAEVSLDSLVTDRDTPKDLLEWTLPFVPLVNVDAGELSNNKLLQVTSAPDSTGYVATTLTVTDPDSLSDELPVRIYSASPSTGIPVIGGLPDLTMLAGTTTSINLNDYYFDANNSDIEMTWSVEGDSVVAVNINSQNLARFTAPTMAGREFYDLVVTVTDPTDKAASETIRVTVLNPGSVVLDLGIVGATRTIFLNQQDTLSFADLLSVGDPGRIRWDVTTNTDTLLTVDLPDDKVLVVPLRLGQAGLTLTATDTISGDNDTATIQYTIRQASTSGTLVVEQIGELRIRAGSDTTIDLTSFIVEGDLPILQWSVFASSNDLAVTIDAAEQATIRPTTTILGSAGAVRFLVEDPSAGLSSLTTATVIVIPGDNTSDSENALEISLVVNPVLESFLDVFVISKLILDSDPFLTVRVRDAPQATPIAVDSVARVSSMWVGDLFLTKTDTGNVEIVAQGRTPDLVTLKDTLQIVIDESGNRSRTELSLQGVSVALPANALRKPSIVVLFPIGSSPPASGAAAKSARPTQELIPASKLFQVHAPGAALEVPGRIRFDLPDRADGVGVYRWEPATGTWDYVDADASGGSISGEFTQFGRYGLFLDAVLPAVVGYDVTADPPGLVFEISETGSGLTDAQLTVNGYPVETTLDAETGRLTWAPTNALPNGEHVLRIELGDRAGNVGQWEEAVDLAHLIPLATTPVLHPNYPNPFNPSTHLAFDLPHSGYVRLTIYNVLGQEVARLVDDTRDAGRHSVRWNALDAAGREVAGGLFLYRLETSSAVLTRKMLFLK